MSNLEQEFQPLISLIVPVHNVGVYLDRLIQSVFEQTYKHWELIFINDNSTDSSADVISGYRDQRIKLIDNSQNLGPSGSRNRGILLSEGDYIQFVDGDDFLDQDALKTEILYLKKSQADILYFNYRVLAPNRTLTAAERRLEKKDILGGEYVEDEQLKLLFSDSISHYPWNFLIKKSIFDNPNNFFPEERYFEDFATIYKWLFSSNKLYLLDKRLYNYVQRSNSTMHTPKINHAADLDRAVVELDEFIQHYKPMLQNNANHYEIPRLLNAYGINLKCEEFSKELENNLRKKLLVKINKIGIHKLSLRNKFKILLIKMNLLSNLYIIKKKIGNIRKHE